LLGTGNEGDDNAILHTTAAMMTVAAMMEATMTVMTSLSFKRE
jgi:hypothetical protein